MVEVVVGVFIFIFIYCVDGGGRIYGDVWFMVDGVCEVCFVCIEVYIMCCEWCFDWVYWKGWWWVYSGGYGLCVVVLWVVWVFVYVGVCVFVGGWVFGSWIGLIVVNCGVLLCKWVVW